MVIAALAAGVPPALAQSGPLNATYTEKFVGPQGQPACPDDAFSCGSGTAAGLGAFTIQATFDDTCGCIVRTLDFSDGSTLVLDEIGTGFTDPGNSGSSNASPKSDGHPGSHRLSWTVAAGTGAFAGATGSGTDDFTAAGAAGTGSITGTITVP